MRTSPLLLLLMAPSLQAAKDARLRVEIGSLRTDAGMVILALYDREDGYPLNLEKAARRLAIPIQGGRASAEIGGLSFGTYALAAIHDEDGDGTLDTSWIGIPTEGVASSNNARGRFGPPAFEDAAFSFSTDGQIMPMRMAYIGD